MNEMTMIIGQPRCSKVIEDEKKLIIVKNSGSEILLYLLIAFSVAALAGVGGLLGGTFVILLAAIPCTWVIYKAASISLANGEKVALDKINKTIHLTRRGKTFPIDRRFGIAFISTVRFSRATPDGKMQCSITEATDRPEFPCKRVPDWILRRRRDEKLATYRYRIGLFSTTDGNAPDFDETLGSFLAAYFDEAAIVWTATGQVVHLSRDPSSV
jgi:hypothetical protein